MSDVLKDAAELLPQEFFIELIKEHVLPEVHNEAFTGLFQQAISKFEAQDELDQIIRFDAHKESLDRQASALMISLEEDPHDGYEEQGDMRRTVGDEMVLWLSDLFRIAIEQGVQLAIVQQCLVLMEGYVVSMMESSTGRSDYSNCYEDYDTETVTDSQGASRYEGLPDQAIPHFWRDLLLMATIQENVALIDEYKSHRNSARKNKRLRHVLLCTPDPERVTKASKRDFEDSWHTDAMKAAVPKLRALLKA